MTKGGFMIRCENPLCAMYKLVMHVMPEDEKVPRINYFVPFAILQVHSNTVRGNT